MSLNSNTINQQKSAKQTIYMKCQDLMTLKNKEKWKKNRIMSATNLAWHFKGKKDNTCTLLSPVQNGMCLLWTGSVIIKWCLSINTGSCKLFAATFFLILHHCYFIGSCLFVFFRWPSLLKCRQLQVESHPHPQAPPDQGVFQDIPSSRLVILLLMLKDCKRVLVLLWR